MRSGLVLVVTLATLAWGAPAALAATVGKSGDVITVTGTNDFEEVEVSFDAGEGNYVFADLLPNDIAFTAPCMEDDDDALRAQCPAAGTARFVMNLGGGSDGSRFDLLGAQSRPATIDGGPGDDCNDMDLTGGSEGDQIDGGDGEDCIRGFGGDDRIVGGPGSDPDLFGGTENDTIDGGDGDDGFNGIDGGLGNDTLNGGPGDDFLTGAAGDDTIRGEAGNDSLLGNDDTDHLFGGPDNDSIRGDDGADDAHGEGGNDILIGGVPDEADVLDGDEGVDVADYFERGAAEPVSVTFDAQANDGAQGEGDNVLDMEDVEGGGGDDTLRGSDNSEFSIMRGLAGNDTINPGTLEDVVSGGIGNDTVELRDGFTDRVTCGNGADTVFADTFDVVAPDCESVTLEERLPARDVPEDRPPAVSFVTPAQNAALTTRTTLTAEASDDRGVVRVLFVDEERTVCTDDVAPYTCDYQPRGEDVGRNTLTAVAVDTANQTGFSTRTVRVPRFTPGLSIAVTPRADRRVPFRFRTSGRVTLPAGVSPALGCNGTVTIQIKSRANTISTRRARVGANCRYSSSVTFRVTRRLVTNRLTVRATYGGNDVLLRNVSRRVGVTVRR
ncbi:MAG TPA: calcium-binding protein [Solirubrobacteraceae bacterium]|nr:calcium-binding protein [Solirubrobacteraceae bacterium]